MQLQLPIDVLCPNRGSETREVLAARDGWACVWCARELDHETATVDHVYPRCAGGGRHPDNLVLACSKCNNRRKSKSARRFLGQNAATARADVVERAIERARQSPLALKVALTEAANEPDVHWVRGRLVRFDPPGLVSSTPYVASDMTFHPEVDEEQRQLAWQTLLLVTLCRQKGVWWWVQMMAEDLPAARLYWEVFLAQPEDGAPYLPGSDS